MTQHLPRYRRVGHLPPISLTERDKSILQAIHDYNGLLSFSQVKHLFFTGKSQVGRRTSRHPSSWRATSTAVRS